MADRFFGLSGSVAVGTNQTLLNLISATTVRPRVYDIVVGCVATPADLATNFQVVRTTAVGTENAGFTPTGLDPGSPASLCDIGQGTYGGNQPTKTANSTVLSFSLNQRATFRWVASPGGELIAPASANNGLAIDSLSSGGTTAHEAMIHWNE